MQTSPSPDLGTTLAVALLLIASASAARAQTEGAAPSQPVAPSAAAAAPAKASPSPRQGQVATPPAPVIVRQPAPAPASDLAQRVRNCEGGELSAKRRPVRLQPVSFPLDDDDSKADSLHCTLVRAQALSIEYANRSDRARAWATALQLPVVGLAAGAADTLLREGTRTKPAAGDADALKASERQANAALRTVGQIGIATTAFVATRNLLLPQGRDLLFLQGWQGMSCLLLESHQFVGSAANTARADMANAESNTVARRQDVAVILSRLDGETLTAQQKQRAEALRQLARLQTELADQAIAKARTDLAAWERRGIVFGLARADVEGRIESRLRNTPWLSYAELLEAAKSAGGIPAPDGEKQTAPTTLEERLKGQRADALLNTLEQALRNLDSERRILIERTRPYDAAIARVAKCPSLVAAS